MSFTYREALTRCALFRALTPEQTALLLGCLSCGMRRLAEGQRSFVPEGSLAAVCSGELGCSWGVARPGDVVFGYSAVTALSRCELVAVDETRLLCLCKNACSFHRAAIASLAQLKPR